MHVFDVGFFDGTDTSYYLSRGYQVTAFEANPNLYEIGSKNYLEAINSGKLQLLNLGIGKEIGKAIDFYIHTDNDEWSTFYKEAAINWGPGKSRIIKVPCITSEKMFKDYGIPDYLKVDIEGYDVLLAEELQHLETKPIYVSFETTDIQLMQYLMLAGYRSFKIVDQARVPVQKVIDSTHNKEFTFTGGSGPFGDDAEGEWISFENACYLFFRFCEDPFSSSAPEGHWFDLHATLKPPKLDKYQQRVYIRNFIETGFDGHCGMIASPFTPNCPGIKGKLLEVREAEIEELRNELKLVHASRIWRGASYVRGLVQSGKKYFKK